MSAVPLLPVVDDHDTGGFFEAAARGELVVRTCNRCAQLLHLPRQHCFACGSDDTGWTSVPGVARLHSWTVVEHQVHPAFPVPYTVVVVELEDREARFIGHLPGRPELHVGDRLTVRFDRADDGTTIPNWELA
jgi:uncharacterized OB-fold protein